MKRRRASRLLLRGYARRARRWRCPAGRRQPLRQERGLHAARPIGQARPRRAGRQRSLAARRGKRYDAAVALTAEEEAELLAPVAAACTPWLSSNRGVNFARRACCGFSVAQFPEERGTTRLLEMGEKPKTIRRTARCPGSSYFATSAYMSLCTASEAQKGILGRRARLRRPDEPTEPVARRRNRGANPLRPLRKPHFSSEPRVLMHKRAASLGRTPFRSAPRTATW